MKTSPRIDGPRRTLVATTIAIALAAAPASAQAPRPTLTFDRSCYGEGEVMSVGGQQYTAGGEVGLLFVHAGRIGSFTTTADPAGAFDLRLAPPDVASFLTDAEDRATIAVTANDQTRLGDGTADSDPEATFASAAITLTRTFARLEPRRPVPGRRLRVSVFGLAEFAGQPLYLHYRRGSTSLKVTPLGKLKGDCGDLEKRVRHAFGGKQVRPGRYTLYISTDRKAPKRGGYFTFKVRIRP